MCFVVLFVFQSKIYPVFGGACVILATFQCHSVGFCIVLCVVLALNSLAVQSRACISVAKYEHSPFFWKPCQKKKSDYFHWERNQTEKNWWRKCQSSEGTSVPVKIQIRAWHSGAFCFQIICILVLLLGLLSSPWQQNQRRWKVQPLVCS